MKSRNHLLTNERKAKEMDHKALLRVVEASNCTVFIEWYEKAQSEVKSNMFYNLCIKQESPYFNILLFIEKFICKRISWSFVHKWIMWNMDCFYQMGDGHDKLFERKPWFTWKGFNYENFTNHVHHGNLHNTEHVNKQWASGIEPIFKSYESIFEIGYLQESRNKYLWNEWTLLEGSSWSRNYSLCQCNLLASNPSSSSKSNSRLHSWVMF